MPIGTTSLSGTKNIEDAAHRHRRKSSLADKIIGTESIAGDFDQPKPHTPSLLDLACTDDLSRIPLHRNLLPRAMLPSNMDDGKLEEKITSQENRSAETETETVDEQHRALCEFLAMPVVADRDPAHTDTTAELNHHGITAAQQLDMREWQERLHAVGVDAGLVAVRMALQSQRAHQQQHASASVAALTSLKNDGGDVDPDHADGADQSCVLDDYDRCVAGQPDIRERVLTMSQELSDKYPAEWCLVLKEWLEALKGRRLQERMALPVMGGGGVETDLVVEDVRTSSSEDEYAVELQQRQQDPQQPYTAINMLNSALVRNRLGGEERIDDDNDQRGSPSQFYDICGLTGMENLPDGYCFEDGCADSTPLKTTTTAARNESDNDDDDDAQTAETKSTVAVLESEEAVEGGGSKQHVVINIPEMDMDADKRYSDDFESLSSSDIEMTTFKTNVGNGHDEHGNEEHHPLLKNYQPLRDRSSSSSSSSSSLSADTRRRLDSQAADDVGHQHQHHHRIGQHQHCEIEANPLRDCSLLGPPQHRHQSQQQQSTNTIDEHPRLSLMEKLKSGPPENKKDRYSSILDRSARQSSAASTSSPTELQDYLFDNDCQSNAELLQQRVQRERRKNMQTDWFQKFISSIHAQHDASKGVKRAQKSTNTDQSSASRSSASTGVSTMNNRSSTSIESASVASSAAKKKKKKKKPKAKAESSFVDLEAALPSVAPPVISPEEQLNKSQIKRRKRAYLKKLLNSNMSLKEAEREVQRVFADHNDKSHEDAAADTDQAHDLEIPETVEEEIEGEGEADGGGDESNAAESEHDESDAESWQDQLENATQSAESAEQATIPKKAEDYESIEIINEDEEEAYARMVSQLSPPDTSSHAKQSTSHETTQQFTENQRQSDELTPKIMSFGTIDSTITDDSISKPAAPGSVTKKRRKRNKKNKPHPSEQTDADSKETKTTVHLPPQNTEEIIPAPSTSPAAVLASPPPSATKAPPSTTNSKDTADEEPLICKPFSIRVSSSVSAGAGFSTKPVIQFPLVIGGNPAKPRPHTLRKLRPSSPQLTVAAVTEQLLPSPSNILSQYLEAECAFHEPSSRLDDLRGRQCLQDFFRHRWHNINDLMAVGSDVRRHDDGDAGMVLELSDSEGGWDDPHYHYA